MAHFTPHLQILPPEQRAVWDELVEVPADFALYGGTAIALHLGHRQSVDFDLFGWRNFVPLDLASQLNVLTGGHIVQSEPNTLTVIIDRGGPVKLSFFGVPRLKKLQPPHVCEDNNLRIASLIDLAGTKLAVIQQRAEAKDYVDVDAVLTSGLISLPEALSAGQAIYGDVFNPQNALKALTFFDEPQLEELTDAMKQRLVSAVRRVDLANLPALEFGL